MEPSTDLDELDVVDLKDLTIEDIGTPSKFRHLKHAHMEGPEVVEKEVKIDPAPRIKSYGKPKQKIKKSLTKKDIGSPRNFRHINHVGYDSELGFEVKQMENLDEELAGFFKLAGVSDQDLADSDTRKFVFDFISQNGGIERARRESANLNSKNTNVSRSRKKRIGEIGLPNNFRHINHAGFNSEGCFELKQMDSLDPKLADFFRLAGVTDKELADEDTRNFIFNFIAQHGGIERARRESFCKTQKPSYTPPKISAKTRASPNINRRRRKKLNKSDIGVPDNFRHVNHVGFDSASGFQINQMNDLEPEILDFFHLAGVTDKQLADEETRKFIFDFVMENGGMEQVKREASQRNTSRNCTRKAKPTSSQNLNKSSKPRITKSDIGSPTDFKHIHHVGH